MPKSDQKQGFSYFWKKVVISFYCKCTRMKDDIVERFLPKNLYQAKFLFLSYGPKLSWPIRLQTFLNFNISKKHWAMKLILCMYLDIHGNFMLVILFYVSICMYMYMYLSINVLYLFVCGIYLCMYGVYLVCVCVCVCVCVSKLWCRSMYAIHDMHLFVYAWCVSILYTWYLSMHTWYM